MSTIPYSQRYIPHELTTRYYAVKFYRAGHSVRSVCRKYHISKASLMRWNSRFAGTKESLADGSHRPLKTHPNAHTEQELKWITDLHRRNPDISLGEMFGKLRERGYTRHYGSLYRVFCRLGYRKQRRLTKKVYKPQPYATPARIGVKWQMDVKYVPAACYVGKMPDKFYQYTMIDEASRERFLYPYKEQSSYSTIDFIHRAIEYFGYKPRIIQTDNGFEFSYFKETDRIHPMDILCRKLGIEHKLIRPRTPRHNGKVERSHRNDQERFYNVMTFYSYDDLLVQMTRYRRRSNNIPMRVLGWLSPLQRRKLLEQLELTSFN